MSGPLSSGTLGTRRSRADGIFNMRLTEALWFVGFNLLLFESPIQSATKFTYIDELMTLCLLTAAMLKLAAKESDRTILGARARTSMLLLLAVICLGLLGNAFWHVQTQATPILIDIFTCAKFPIALLSACVVFSGSGIVLFRTVEAEAKALVVILIVLGLANLFVDFGMGVDPRYGLRASFRAMFGHPTYLVFACVGLSVILLANWKSNMPWVLLTLTIVALSLRSKGLVYVALVITLMLFFSRRNRLSILHIIICSGLVFFIAYDQFVTYFQTDGYARTELLRTSFWVARDYAPLGSGFATYGSAITADPSYYSPVYYKYGLSTVWGLAPGRTNFLSDTFWPTILGQFGWIGLACYAGMLAALFVLVYRMSDRVRLAVICCFFYLFVSSTSESAFFNPQSVYLAVCLGLVMSVDKIAS